MERRCEARARTWAWIVPSALFCLSMFLLTWRVVDLPVVYHGGGVIFDFPVFYWGMEHLQERLSQPGGLLDYLVALAAQTYAVAWAGALLTAGLAWLLYLVVRIGFRGLGGDAVHWLALLPGCLLVAANARYTVAVSALTLACSSLAGLACAASLLRGTTARAPIRALGALGAALALLLAAPGAGLLFFLTAALIALRQRDLVRLGALALAALCLPPLIGGMAYQLTPREAYLELVPLTPTLRSLRESNTILLFGLYLCPLPLLGVAWWWGGRAKARGEPAHTHPAVPRPAGAPRDAAGRVATAGLALACVLGLLAPWGLWAVTVNPKARAALQVDYFAYHRQWDQVVAAARNNPGSLRVDCAVNQALFHLGRLGDDLRLGGSGEALLLYDQRYRPDWIVIDVYLDLGFVGMAHHYLIEACDIYGERPALLRRLAVVNTVLGNVGTAKIYLRALAKVPFHGAWARAFLARLEEDPVQAADKEVARLRGLMMRRDQMIPLGIDQLMLSLLEANPRNRMAFEYLMAYYLMTKDLKGFTRQLPHLDQFSMGELPRLYQEAIVVAARDLGLKIEALRAAVSPSTVERHDAFTRRLQAAPADRAQAVKDLQPEFGDSYFYYYFTR